MAFQRWPSLVRFLVSLIVLTAVHLGATPSLSAEEQFTQEITSKIYEANKKSIIYIKVEWKIPSGETQFSYGTGLIIDDSGHVVTNSHVVMAGFGSECKIDPNRCEVPPNSTRVKISGVIGKKDGNHFEMEFPPGSQDCDPRLNCYDAAVIKFKGQIPDESTPIQKFADFNMVTAINDWRGKPVSAFGFPKDAGLSPAHGIVSNPRHAHGIWMLQFPQAKGSSGSPIFNTTGEVVGLVFSGQNAAISYGIPWPYVVNEVLNAVLPRESSYYQRAPSGSSMSPNGSIKSTKSKPNKASVAVAVLFDDFPGAGENTSILKDLAGSIKSGFNAALDVTAVAQSFPVRATPGSKENIAFVPGTANTFMPVPVNRHADLNAYLQANPALKYFHDVVVPDFYVHLEVATTDNRQVALSWKFFDNLRKTVKTGGANVSTDPATIVQRLLNEVNDWVDLRKKKTIFTACVRGLDEHRKKYDYLKKYDLQNEPEALKNLAYLTKTMADVMPVLPGRLTTHLERKMGKDYEFNYIDNNIFFDKCTGDNWKTKQRDYIRENFPTTVDFVVNGNLVSYVTTEKQPERAYRYEFELEVHKDQPGGPASGTYSRYNKANALFTFKQDLPSIPKPLAEFIACKWYSLERKLSGLGGEGKSCEVTDVK